MIPEKLSVIVPAYNASSSIRRCVEHILLSEDPCFEVLILDDGSSDGTAQAVADLPVRVWRSAINSGAACTRNQGARLAEGEILVFIDSDVLIRPDTLGSLRTALVERDAAAVFGIFSVHGQQTRTSSILKNLYCHYVNAASAGYASQFSSCCGAVRKSIFLDLGGFSERYTAANMEDVDLGYRLSGRGARIFLDSTIQVEHLKEYTLRGLLHNDFSRARAWAALLAEEKLLRQRPLLKRECNLSAEQLRSFLWHSLALSSSAAGLLVPPALPLAGFCAAMYLVTNRRFFRLVFQHLPRGPALSAVGQYFLSQSAALLGAQVGLIDHLVRRR